MKDGADTAYYLPEPSHNARLTDVVRGTPMGELLRRYWLPVGLAGDATDLPKAVRALGETLILFRDGSGRPGLMHARCCHRGTSLLYGRVEQDGIRCCYHGWKFDAEGRVLERPAEPNPGPIGAFRQPWYPAEERYGLIFAYLGPAERKPLLPRYDVFEDLNDGEQLWTDDHNLGAGQWQDAVPFNWLQHFENIHDPAHFFWLHYLHSGPQFGERFGEMDLAAIRAYLPMIAAAGRYETNDRGVTARTVRPMPDGGTLETIIETALPMLRVVPNPFGTPGPVDHIGFMLPVDDTHFRIFTVLRARDRSFFDMFLEMGRADVDRSAEDRQRFPNDLEAQGSQGPITLHSEEHLGASDRGVVAVRRMFEAQLQALKDGRDPLGVHFEPGREYVRLAAGSFITEPENIRKTEIHHA